LAATCGGLAVLLAASGCGGASGPTAAGARTPVSGGVVTYALPANTVPNYIFPFTSIAYFNVVNTDNLEYLLYRPLYWFGSGHSPFMNDALSLASPPVYNGQVVTINLKRYKWSNNAQVTAYDVLFWMHMMQAVGKADWGAYVPHEFPDNVSSVRVVSPTQIRMVIKGKYSQAWFTDNELSQITPMPQAWDYSSATTKSDCTHVVSDCAAVYNYLNSKAQNPASWPGSPIWSVVDGPWRLASYSSQGAFTFRLNPRYSGRLPKDHISVFTEVPFTSEEAEYNVLQAGGANQLDVGYLPTVDAPVPPPGAGAGQNPVPGYQLQALYYWGISYIPYNFASTDPQAAILRQLYFRQAFQDLVNQAEIIQGPLHGYGKVSTGPVGDYPVTAFLAPKARNGSDPFPYNPVQARSLLQLHGWQINPSGVSTCGRAGPGPTQCGAGVKAGARLEFTLPYTTGSAWVEAAVLQLKSNASLVGIDIKVIPQTFNQVTGQLAPTCGASGKRPCPWELLDWGGGWVYSPDYLPTGEQLFMTGAASNVGAYTNGTNDKLIIATVQNSSPQAMWVWENYLTPRLPIVMQPLAPSALVENISSLHIGVQSATLTVTPELWYYVK
jgi:peptide/nickel transport system substrate-binding protein